MLRACVLRALMGAHHHLRGLRIQQHFLRLRSRLLALAPLLLTAALESEVTTLAGLTGSFGTVDGVSDAHNFPRGASLALGCGASGGEDVRGG